LSRKELQVYFEKYKELSLQKANPQVQNEISSQSMVASSMQRMSQLSLSSKVARMNGIFNKLATALKKEKFSKKSLFNAIDRNHSGRIDRDELATAFNSMKIILADDELDFIFSSLDKDQSGFVDENEFLSQLP
jgi:EF-hand domain pair